MKIQEYVINKKDFNTKHIFECGQCFRWNIQENGSYIGVVGQSVIEVIENENEIIFKGISNKNLEDVINKYFNLNVEYSKIKRQLSSVDEFLKESIEYGNGIRILKQDLFETIISFIISANNNIPRIKKIIENISKTYGKKLSYNGRAYYAFPTVQELSIATVEDLRKLGVGFRDVRIYNTTRMILDKKINLEVLQQEDNMAVIREELLKLDGVGPKVADCILLFGFNRYEVFPIDVWVRRVMNDLYIKNKDENKVSKVEIKRLAREKYGMLAGLAQQYLFYWKRENK